MMNVKWKLTECVNLSVSVLLHLHHSRPPPTTLETTGMVWSKVCRPGQLQLGTPDAEKQEAQGTDGRPALPAPGCPFYTW